MKFLISTNRKLVPIDDEFEGENIIEVDESELPDALYPYYMLDEDGNIIPDEQKILDKAKRVKEAEIRDRFEETIKQGYYSENYDITMDCDFFDAMKLKSGIELTQQLGESETIVRDYYNQDHLLSIDDANQLVIEIGLYYLQQWKKKGELLEAINQAETVDEVLAVEWDTEA